VEEAHECSQGHLCLPMNEKKYGFCLHFDRSHVERSGRVRTEYKRRQRNGGKKNHYCGRNCSRDIVDSGVETVHCRGRIVVCR
jgi:hypothetical protein